MTDACGTRRARVLQVYAERGTRLLRSWYCARNKRAVALVTLCSCALANVHERHERRRHAMV